MARYTFLSSWYSNEKNRCVSSHQIVYLHNTNRRCSQNFDYFSQWWQQKVWYMTCNALNRNDVAVMAIQAEECNWMRLPFRVSCILLFECLLCDLCNILCVIKRYLCFQAKIKCPEIKVTACSNRSTELWHSKIDEYYC